MYRVHMSVTGSLEYSVQPVLWLKDNMKSSPARLLALNMALMCYCAHFRRKNIFCQDLLTSENDLSASVTKEVWVGTLLLTSNIIGQPNQITVNKVKPCPTFVSSEHRAIEVKCNFMLSLICPYFQLVKYF